LYESIVCGIETVNKVHLTTASSKFVVMYGEVTHSAASRQKTPKSLQPFGCHHRMISRLKCCTYCHAVCRVAKTFNVESVCIVLTFNQ